MNDLWKDHRVLNVKEIERICQSLISNEKAWQPQDALD